MQNLPKHVLDFFVWYFGRAPKKIYIVSTRAIRLLNNELSLTLNLRLLFTPLYNDYTKLGRIIGFVYRILKMFFGIWILLLFVISLTTIIIFWYVLPFLIIYYLKLGFFAFVLVTYLVKEFMRDDSGEFRVSELAGRPYTQSFRTTTLSLFDKLRTTGNDLAFLSTNKNIHAVLYRCELIGSDFFHKLNSSLANLDKEKLKSTSYEFAQTYNSRYVEPEHLFLAILAQATRLDILLSAYKLEFKHIESCVEWMVSIREDAAKAHFWQIDYAVPLMGGIDKGRTGRITPFLDAHSVDLTKEAHLGRVKKPVGKDEVIEQIISLLGASGQKNVMIIGEPGSGKTTAVHGLALQIIKGTPYDSLKFKRIVSLDTGLVAAGTKSIGDVSSKISMIMNEIEGSRDIILFIDEMHNFLMGDDSSLSGVFSVLETYAATGKFQIIGATSSANYRKYIEPAASFARLFEVVEVPEATPEVSLEILKDEALLLEQDYGIVISYPALVATVNFCKKLIHERVFPDKAVDVLRRTCTSLKNKKFVVAEDIANQISLLTHVPVSTINETESQKLLNIDAEMKKMVIGQDPAIIQIASALKRARVGIRNENKPIASFLFVGTTGVGKTQTAKALAKNYFGDEKAMIRLDMSEYQQQDSINRLLGTPDATVAGYLTEQVRSKPFSLILLDEIEKAHPNILLAFLQVLDDGRLTDSQGRTIDFTNAIIIATSNVGTRSIQQIAQHDGVFEEMKAAAMTDVENKFAPELLNRFNGIIVFKPLSRGDVRKIADLILNRVRAMADAKGIKVTFAAELIDELAKRGFDPQNGARPLARVIEEYVETNLAERILQGDLVAGEEFLMGTEIFE
jgi:ATP-dependent Clp protease ATP-binding subunit ClpC